MDGKSAAAGQEVEDRADEIAEMRARYQDTPHSQRRACGEAVVAAFADVRKKIAAISDQRRRTNA